MSKPKLDMPVTVEKPRSPEAEAFHILRNNLSFAAVDNPARTILVTSPMVGEGKSTIVANLGAAMAQAGFRTLIVDGDLRRPRQHQIFGLDNSKGLTTCLVKDSDPEEAASTGPVDNLKILTSGPIPPNPAELLSSERARHVWTRVGEKFDCILVDSPPLLATADASTLASQLDGVLLVFMAGKTRIETAQAARDQLAKAKARVLGAVLNRLKSREQSYYYYYYSHSDGAKQ